MPYTRRRVISSCTATVCTGAAGCSVLGDEPDTSPPDPPDCPDEPRLPDADAQPGEEIPLVPESPSSLDEEVVVEYVEEYESVYVWRRSMRRHGSTVKRVQVGGEAEATWTGVDGVLVEFDTIFPSGRLEREDGGIHFDEPRYSASYLVTYDAVWRAESEWSDHPPDPPHPRREGELVQCY